MSGAVFYGTDSVERRNVPLLLIALSALSAYALFGIIEAMRVEAPWWLDIPSVAGIYVLAYRAFDSTGWKWTPLRRLGVVSVPILDGEWTGAVTSSYSSELTTASLRIAQSWTRIAVEMTTASSSSRTLAATVNESGLLTYEYMNEPRALAPSGMSPHRGSAWLQLTRDDSGERLSGEYFAGRGRQTQGTIDFVRA